MGIRAWAAGGLAFGLVVGGGVVGRGQGLLPPAPGADLEDVSRRMAEGLRDLGRRVAGDGRSPAGPYLARDCEELQRSAGEWHESNRRMTDPYQLRRSYSGIDTSWHRLRGQFAAAAIPDPAIAEEIRRVDQADAAIHQALNLNAFHPNLEGAAAAPAGLDESRRLAYGMAQRGEALAAAILAVYGPNPDTAVLVNGGNDIARMVDGFSDGLNSPNGPLTLEQVQQAYVPILKRSIDLGINLDRYQMPPDLRSTWLAYTNALNLTQNSLGLKNFDPNTPQPPPNAPVGFPSNPNPAPQVAQWADGLDRQVDELIENFAPTARVVPEGRDMLGEMTRLRDDVRNFRGDAARGLDPARLAFEFREVDADWQRLARRVNRIARGRTGPNIQRVQQIGQTCEQIHQVLGMPGYPPVIQPY